MTTPPRVRTAALWLLAGCVLLGAAWWQGRRTQEAEKPAQFAAYYTAGVEPLLERASARESAASALAVKRLRDHFTAFHAGVPAFADDITAWGTRFGIVGRSVGDLWTRFWEDKSKATAVREYANGKFRAHVISEERLKAALNDAMKTWSDAIAASDNRLQSEVALALAMPDCPVKMPAPALAAHFQKAASSPVSGRDAGGSVIQGVAAFSGGVIAGEMSTRLIAAVLTRVAASTAAAAAIEGGAAAGATATGGAAGSLGGPLGTVVGAGVGIVVGFLVDSWMTESFKEKLHEQCSSFLYGLERDLVAELRTALAAASQQHQAGLRDAMRTGLAIP